MKIYVHLRKIEADNLNNMYDGDTSIHLELPKCFVFSKLKNKKIPY